METESMCRLFIANASGLVYSVSSMSEKVITTHRHNQISKFEPDEGVIVEAKIAQVNNVYTRNGKYFICINEDHIEVSRITYNMVSRREFYGQSLGIKYYELNGKIHII